MLVEHDGAVHLAGESHAGDFLCGKSGILDGLRNCDAAGAPPVFWLLLGPTDFRRGKRSVFFSRRGDDVTLRVDDQCSCTACSNINAQGMDKLSP
jgi:hypothetical protein